MRQLCLMQIHLNREKKVMLSNPTVKAENKEDLAYDDEQELKETKEDINHSDVMLGEVEEKVIEDFLSLVADLE